LKLFYFVRFKQNRIEENENFWEDADFISESGGPSEQISRQVLNLLVRYCWSKFLLHTVQCAAKKDMCTNKLNEYRADLEK